MVECIFVVFCFCVWYVVGFGGDVCVGGGVYFDVVVEGLCYV